MFETIMFRSSGETTLSNILLHLRDVVVCHLNSRAGRNFDVHNELTRIRPRKERFANQRIRRKAHENNNADHDDDHPGAFQCLADLSDVPSFESAEGKVELVHYDTEDAYSLLPTGCRVRILIRSN